MNYGWIVAVLGPIGGIIVGRWYYIPSLRRFAVALKAEDPATWANIGSPDGSIFGSPSTPKWTVAMAKYLLGKKYADRTSERLRVVGDGFRATFIAFHIALFVWFVLVIMLAMFHPETRTH